MNVETAILDFQPSNTFEQYEAHINANEQKTMFKNIGLKNFYIVKSLDDTQRSTIIFQGPGNVASDLVQRLGYCYLANMLGSIFLHQPITYPLFFLKRWLNLSRARTLVQVLPKNKKLDKLSWGTPYVSQKTVRN